MLWLYFMGMLFTLGLCYGDSQLADRPLGWHIWTCAVLLWPFVLGISFAELINNTRGE